MKSWFDAGLKRLPIEIEWAIEFAANPDPPTWPTSERIVGNPYIGPRFPDFA
jgi:hypothetical protein